MSNQHDDGLDPPPRRRPQDILSDDTDPLDELQELDVTELQIDGDSDVDDDTLDVDELVGY